MEFMCLCYDDSAIKSFNLNHVWLKSMIFLHNTDGTNIEFFYCGFAYALLVSHWNSLIGSEHFKENISYKKQFYRKQRSCFCKKKTLNKIQPCTVCSHCIFPWFESRPKEPVEEKSQLFCWFFVQKISLLRNSFLCQSHNFFNKAQNNELNWSSKNDV